MEAGDLERLLEFYAEDCVFTENGQQRIRDGLVAEEHHASDNAARFPSAG